MQRLKTCFHKIYDWYILIIQIYDLTDGFKTSLDLNLDII